MSQRSIQDVIALNQELSALAAAGLPLDLGQGTHGQAVAGTGSTSNSFTPLLDRINTALSLRVGRGQSLEQAVMDEVMLPPVYRKALLTFLRCDDPRLTLDTLMAPAVSRQRFASGIGTSLIYPLIIFSVAYVGFLFLCYFTVPKLEGMYLQMEQKPPFAVAMLVAAQDSAHLWGPLIPVLIAFAMWWWKRRGSTLSWWWLPGGRRYYRAVQNSQIANQIAGMLESGCSLPESLATAFPTSALPGALFNASGQRTPAREVEARTSTDVPGVKNLSQKGADPLGQDQMPNEIDSPPKGQTTFPIGSKSLPPLLQWAIQGDIGDEPLSKVMRFVAVTYQETARRQERLWRLLIPTLFGLSLGGLIVLAYGLSLFVPVVEMLRDFATAGSRMGGL